MPRVLVVDDERVIADTLALILRQYGYHVAVAYDGELAVTIARNTYLDALISDVVMPRLNGIEAALMISTMHPDCKVILISGQAATADLLAANEQARSFEILTKPVHPDEILNRLRAGVTL